MNTLELQQEVSRFVEKNGLETKTEIRFLDLVSEIGELSKEFLKNTDYGKKDLCITENWLLEFGDISSGL